MVDMVEEVTMVELAMNFRGKTKKPLPELVFWVLLDLIIWLH